jgi:thiol-disulfide isomerase/thioredoxin
LFFLNRLKVGWHKYRFSWLFLNVGCGKSFKAIHLGEPMLLEVLVTPGETLATSQVELSKILERLAGKPAMVYFEAGWCEDCKTNKPAIEKFIESKLGAGPDITLLRVVASAERGDWRLSKEQGGGPNWQNPFRVAPWKVESLPHAAVMAYADGGIKAIERVLNPDGLGLNYLYERACLLQR